MPTVFLMLVSGFVALQVKAARIHTSVELTPERLRQGTETVRLVEILRVYPEARGRRRRNGSPRGRSAS